MVAAAGVERDVLQGVQLLGRVLDVGVAVLAAAAFVGPVQGVEARVEGRVLEYRLVAELAVALPLLDHLEVVAFLDLLNWNG